MTNADAGIGTIGIEITIEGLVADVWRALTDDINVWWPDDFYAGGKVGRREFSLDAKPGGCMFERWDEGGGVLWGTVVSSDPQKSLQVLGHLFPNWGGPSQWYGSWELSTSGKHTKLRFTESSLGKISDDGMKNKEEGWQALWACLKAYVEDRP